MKLKAKAKDCQLLVKVKTTSKEILDEKELDRFSRLFLRGFLKPKLIKKDQIEYTGPIGIPLSERFKKPVSKRDFLFILEQVVVAVQKLQANNFGVNNLVMNLEYVYINEVTKEVQFVCVPTTSGIENLNLIEFIEKIAYSVRPADEKDNDFVSRFVYYFRAIQPFDINKVELFVAKEDRSVVNTIKKQNAGQSGFMTNKPQHYYEHYEEKKEAPDEDATKLLSENDDSTALLVENDNGPTVIPSQVDDEATGLLDDTAESAASSACIDNEATGLLGGYNEATGIVNDADDEATGLLFDAGEAVTTERLTESQMNAHFPTLYRVLTEESICVNKPVFRLGKERSYVDYFVTNNIAVSRSHADIITRGNRYFVKDLNSKNRTYINGRELPVQMEVEITDGDSLKLGNEEFIFRV